MTDREALDFLVAKFGTDSATALALNVTPQVLNNWYGRGISAKQRPKVWAMVNDHGGNLSRDWLIERAA